MEEDILDPKSKQVTVLMLRTTLYVETDPETKENVRIALEPGDQIKIDRKMAEEWVYAKKCTTDLTRKVGVPPSEAPTDAS